MAREVKVVDYNPEWIKLFREEAAIIAAIFGDQLVAIHHIGSTAIPGMPAKPTIDILPVVRDIACVDSHLPAMIDLGYHFLGEFGIPGRRFFYKPTDEVRTHHVHIYEETSPEIERHVTFRDFMRVHVDEAHEYGRLKEKLAGQFPTDIQGYNAGKDAFIKDMDRLAAEWRSSQ